MVNFNTATKIREVSEISKEYKFGTVAWQRAMFINIQNKLDQGIALDATDKVFIETEKIHLGL